MEALKGSFKAEEPDIITWVCSPILCFQGTRRTAKSQSFKSSALCF